MSYLPKEGRVPAGEALVEKSPEKREALLTIGQFAAVRKLQSKIGGFKHGQPIQKRTLAQWDALWTEYWNKPIRG